MSESRICKALNVSIVKNYPIEKQILLANLIENPSICNQDYQNKTLNIQLSTNKTESIQLNLNLMSKAELKAYYFKSHRHTDENVFEYK